MREDASEEVGLFHDADEVLLADLAGAAAVGLVDHLLQLLLGHGLAQLAGHALEVLEADLARVVVVEELEGADDLLLGVAVGLVSALRSWRTSAP